MPGSRPWPTAEYPPSYKGKNNFWKGLMLILQMPSSAAMQVYWSSREKSNKEGIVCNLLKLEIQQSSLPVQDLTAPACHVLFWVQRRTQRAVDFRVEQNDKSFPPHTLNFEGRGKKEVGEYEAEQDWLLAFKAEEEAVRGNCHWQRALMN